MELHLERPLLFFDIESTGLNIPTASIVELCFVKVFPGRSEPEVKTWRMRPWDYDAGKQRHIEEEASRVNGIKDEMVSGCPRFLELAPEICTWLRDSDFAGFNSTKFDLPMLAEELERVRKYCRERIAAFNVPEASRQKARQMLSDIEIDLHAPIMVDVQNIYHAMEPRNLRAAYRFYCGGRDFQNAHSAEADTMATYEVLKAQLDLYKEPAPYREQVLRNDVASLSAFVGKKYVDFSGHLIYDDSGKKDPAHILINFGKHKGRSVRDVYLNEPSYFAWVDQGSFALDTKAQFSRIKNALDEERKGPASREQLNALRDKFNGSLF